MRTMRDAAGLVSRLGSLPGLVAIVTVGLSTANAQTSSRDDYMSVEHRARVEALKADAEQNPTDGSNLAERTPVLWRWINSFSLSGGPLPERAVGILQSAFRELFEAERQGRQPRVSLDQRPDGRAIYADARFDQVIEELRLKDERPGALGRFKLSSGGPFTADSWITVELTFTVGDLPLEQGGRVVVGRSSQWDRGDLQNDGPGEGFFTIRASKPGARFAKVEIPRGPERYSAVSARPAFRVVGAEAAGVKGFAPSVVGPARPSSWLYAARMPT